MATNTVCQLPVQRKLALAAATVGMAERHLFPVALRHGAELHGAEGLRRDLAHLLDWSRDPRRQRAGSGCRIRVRLPRMHGAGIATTMDQCAPADIAEVAVADPVARHDAMDAERPPAILVVAEAQHRVAGIVDLGDEMLVEGTAVEEVGHRGPDFGRPGSPGELPASQAATAGPCGVCA